MGSNPWAGAEVDRQAHEVNYILKAGYKKTRNL
jgi:hypothetical protein